MEEAFKNNDFKTLKQYKMPQGYCNLFVDSSLEDGNETMTKFLINQFKCQPSLYAKQMAQINGHQKLSLWVESYGTLRNNTNIKSVHYNYKSDQWSQMIPEEYRY